MRRHAKVYCESREKHYYVPYSSEGCDTPQCKGSIPEQVMKWCQEYGLEDAIMTETASKVHLRVKLY